MLRYFKVGVQLFMNPYSNAASQELKFGTSIQGRCVLLSYFRVECLKLSPMFVSGDPGRCCHCECSDGMVIVGR